MKHLNLIKVAVLAAVLSFHLSSCTKDNTHMRRDSEPMDLHGVASVPSKGVITGTTFPTTRSMNVSADLMANTGGSGNFFSNRVFSYATSSWTPAIATYWPLAGNLEILAYSAGSASVTDTWTNATQVVLSCSDCTADDILMGGLTGANSSNNTVAFKHCLAQVNVTAAASAASVVKIKSITITAYKGATLTITKSAGSSAVSVATATSGSQTANTIFSGNQTVTASAAAVGTSLLLPAQTPSKITISYTMTTGGTESPVMTVEKTISSALVAGNAYTYAIGMTLTGITLTATLTDWSASTVNIAV